MPPAQRDEMPPAQRDEMPEAPPNLPVRGDGVLDKLAQQLLRMGSGRERLGSKVKQPKGMEWSWASRHNASRESPHVDKNLSRVQGEDTIGE
eukprot:1741177-Pleurochrysis_carterae.AAC.2